MKNTFRWIIPLIVLSSVSGGAEANDTLGHIMKTIGSDFRQMSLQITKPQAKAANAKRCDEITAAIQQAALIQPDSVNALPEDEHGSAISHYNSLIQSLLRSIATLKKDILGNNLTAAVKEMKQILKIRDIAHQIFAPDDQGVDLTFKQSGLIAHCVWIFGPSLTNQAILRIFWVNAINRSPVNPPTGFSVRLTMPEMPEMNNLTPVITQIKNTLGTYEISHIYASMDGAWDLNITVPTGPAPETEALHATVSADF